MPIIETPGSAEWAVRLHPRSAGRWAAAAFLLLHTLHDATDPRLLGQWLAQRAAIPLDDRIPTPADRAQELARAREALAATGRLGRFLARHLKPRNPR